MDLVLLAPEDVRLLDAAAGTCREAILASTRNSSVSAASDWRQDADGTAVIRKLYGRSGRQLVRFLLHVPASGRLEAEELYKHHALAVGEQATQHGWRTLQAPGTRHNRGRGAR